MAGHIASLGTLAVILVLTHHQVSGGSQTQLDKSFKGELASGFEEPNFRITRHAVKQARKGQHIKNKNKSRKQKTQVKTKSGRRNPKKTGGKRKSGQQKYKKLQSKSKSRKQKHKKTKAKRKSRKRKHKKNKKRNKSRKRKHKKSQTKKKSKKRKYKKTQARKKSRYNKNKKGKHQKKSGGAKLVTACDQEKLKKKIKEYIKMSNNLRQARRIDAFCKIMEKKENKSETAFQPTIAALTSSSCGNFTSFIDRLKNCSATAKIKCNSLSVEACTATATTSRGKCEKELQTGITNFTGCLAQDVVDTCACINALPPPPAGCLNFKNVLDTVKLSKVKCAKQFGTCRKIQQDLALELKGICNTSSGNDAAHALYKEILLHHGETIKNLTMSNLEAFKLDNINCPISLLLQCVRKIIEALDVCYEEYQPINPPALEFLKCVIEKVSPTACEPCIYKACRMSGLPQFVCNLFKPEDETNLATTMRYKNVMRKSIYKKIVQN